MDIKAVMTFTGDLRAARRPCSVKGERGLCLRMGVRRRGWWAFCLVLLGLPLWFTGPASAAAAVRIASVFFMSGDSVVSNLHHIQAVRLAVDEINRAGGLLGHPVELIELDNHGTSIQSRRAAVDAVDKQVLAVIGASWSDRSLAMAPVLQKAGIPMISPDSTNPAVTLAGDYIFRACYTDAVQGAILARFAHEGLKSQRATVIEDVSSSYSMGLAGAFIREFRALGGTIISRYEYTSSVHDYSILLDRVREDKPDILFIPGHDESGHIVKQARAAGLGAKLLGGDGWDSGSFLERGGGTLDEGYYTTHWASHLDSAASRHFVEQYGQLYSPNNFAALTYDAVQLLADAVRRAGTLDRAAIRQALAETRDFKGATGSISMDSNGDPVKPVMIMKIENGRPVYYGSMMQ